MKHTLVLTYDGTPYKWRKLSIIVILKELTYKLLVTAKDNNYLLKSFQSAYFPVTSHDLITPENKHW